MVVVHRRQIIEAIGVANVLVVSQILRDLGLRKIRIMTNNPKKIYGIEGYGLSVVEEVPIRIAPGEHNEKYLATKKSKLGHRL